MSRLIDADKLRDEIKNMIHPMSTPDGAGMYDVEINAYNEAMVDVLETINEQPTVEVPETGKWIPADQPPKTNGVYTITYRIQDEEGVHYLVGASYFDGQDTWHNDICVNHGRKYLDVIAWKPRPAPYHPNKCHGCFGAENNDCERCVDEE